MLALVAFGSLLASMPQGQGMLPEAQERPVYLKIRVLSRLEAREARAFEELVREKRRSDRRYGRFHAQLIDVRSDPLGVPARRRSWDLALGLFDREVEAIASDLLQPLAGKPWWVLGGECQGFLDARGPVAWEEGIRRTGLWIPDPLRLPQIAVSLAHLVERFGPEAFEALRQARAPGILLDSQDVRARLVEEATGLLRLGPEETVKASIPVRLELCMALHRSAAEEPLIRDFALWLLQPEQRDRLWLRQGYLAPRELAAIDSLRSPELPALQEAARRWLHGEADPALPPEETEETLTTILLLGFGCGILLLIWRSRSLR